MLIKNLADFFYQKIKNKLKKYQFQSFLLAVSQKNIDQKKAKEFKILLGQKLEKKLKKTVDFQTPDILILIDLVNKKIDLKIKPLYILGRYQKIKAGIPQTRWYKKRYQTSVQEEIGDIILKESRGEDHSFHGCGREDIDVLMLGNGRPFVIEIKNPKIREINLKKIEEKINKESKYIKVFNLKFTNKKKIKEIKSAKPDKIYETKVKIEKPIKKEKLEAACKKLSKIIINQKTPTRVLRRRINITRKRKIYYFKIKKYHSLNPIFEIKTQSGTYIKELISGDNGRTTPSLSEMLNQKCYVTSLKVIKIDDEFLKKSDKIRNNE